MVSSKSTSGPIQIGSAHLVDNHLDALEVTHKIVVHEALVEKELVDQPRATSRLNRDPKTQIVATLSVVV
jgi:hypothetical protein